MSLSKLRKKLLRFHSSERASSLTEFTLFLPIWIMVFIGIINLGRVGIFSTKIQLRAQRDLWTQAVDISDGFEGEHLVPVSGGTYSLGKYAEVAGMDGNDQKINDGIESGLQAALIGNGHYGESTDKAYIPMYPFLPDGVKDKLLPSDVLEQDDQGRYPHKILNDSIADANYNASGVAGIISALVAASGFTHAVAAGIRYGSLFSNHTETENFIADYGTFTAGAHYDVLVPPRALTEAEAFAVPFGVAFAQFKTDDKYQEYLMFGSENWGGGDGTADTPQEGEWDDEVDNKTEDDIDEQCQSICDSWDNEEDDGPKPPNYDKCGC